ncbi:helix-turn-helix domain-containing protein [Ancylobacter amanitiformis]|uniref:AraC-like DNA-binding protein n=1 Tax=Ancylobacter amanitiformis TaxID=217069 RepID=A0ABU0LU36_9HYPH|nr:AraC family transcriptional regulator [Ancylobacter amanitiformis]MDQ0512211.1 AraC-like DNA-binding protein [Ancylobacter amanitiformis]
MSLHVTPPFEAFAVNARAGEIIGSRSEGRTAPAFDGFAPGALPDERLSVQLGHMGVVIAVSTPAQGGPVGASFRAPARTETADTIQLLVTRSDFERLAGLLVDDHGDEGRLASSTDPVIQRLALALGSAERSDKEFGGVYADALRLAIVTRLLAADTRCEEETGEQPGMPAARISEIDAPSSQPRRPKTGLPKWRFKRVAAYVEEHLGEAVTLADMAEAAGLSRMHFAAQFRIATGVRPHEYLLRRRIERAQEMLLESRDSLVEIALGVGFQTQAHFTTVFRRFVGDTPYQWRCANRNRG